MDERRKEQRTKAEDYLQVYDNTSDQTIGQVADLSQHGTMVIAENSMKPGTVTNCRMALPEWVDDGDKTVFDLKCRWCMFDKDSGKYHVGFELHEMSDEAAATIHALLKSWARSRTSAPQA